MWPWPRPRPVRPLSQLPVMAAGTSAPVVPPPPLIRQARVRFKRQQIACWQTKPRDGNRLVTACPARRCHRLAPSPPPALLIEAISSPFPLEEHRPGRDSRDWPGRRGDESAAAMRPPRGRADAGALPLPPPFLARSPLEQSDGEGQVRETPQRPLCSKKAAISPHSRLSFNPQSQSPSWVFVFGAQN